MGWYNGLCDLDFWVNLNLTVKGKTRPQRVILEKNISGWTCILSVCAGGLRVEAGRKFGGWTVNLFCLSFDQEEATVGYILIT